MRKDTGEFTYRGVVVKRQAPVNLDAMRVEVANRIQRSAIMSGIDVHTQMGIVDRMVDYGQRKVVGAYLKGIDETAYAEGTTTMLNSIKLTFTHMKMPETKQREVVDTMESIVADVIHGQETVLAAGATPSHVSRATLEGVGRNGAARG